MVTGDAAAAQGRQDRALSLIQGVLALTQDGLHIPAPVIVDWTDAIDAIDAQSEGRSHGKTVVRL